MKGIIATAGAMAIVLGTAATAHASRIVYSCGAEICVVNPESGAAQQLTTDGASSPYRHPSVSRDGKRIAAARGDDVMAGDYGSNLTTRVAGTRDMNDVAISPDGAAVAESHSYVVTRYGCPLTGGCLELVDKSGTEFTAGGAAFGHYGGGGVGFLGAGALLSSFYSAGDKLHGVCVVATPGLPGAECVPRISAAETLSGPDGSPDGALIAVAVANAVTLYDAATGAPVRKLADGANPAFSPDGRELAYVAPDGWINVVPTAGGKPRRLVEGSSPSWGEGTGPGPAVASKTLRYRKARVAVKVACEGSDACRGTLRLKKGKTLLGKRAYRVAAGRTATVNLKPSGRGARTLARSRKHRVVVELKPSQGTTLSTKVTLRR